MRGVDGFGIPDCPNGVRGSHLAIFPDIGTHSSWGRINLALRLSLQASSPNPRVAIDAYESKVMPAHRRLSLRTPRKIDHSYMHEIGPGRHPDTEVAAPIGDARSDRATIRRVQYQDRRVRKRSCTGDVWPANRCGGAFNNVPRNAGPVARCSYLGPCCGTTDSHKT